MKSLFSFSILLLIIFTSSHAFSSSINSVVPKCHPEESSALLRFKSSFSIATSLPCSEDLYSSDVTKWNASTNCCEWDGITCDEGSGHIVGLDLLCGKLEGTLSSNSSLFSLAHLEILSLAYNDFRGSPISPAFGRFKNLTALYLLGSNFSGNVPIEIARLNKLVSFYLMIEYNDYKKMSMEAATFKALARNMTDLKELVFLFVDMSYVPLVAMTNLSSSLARLTLITCDLDGELPKTAFRRFSKLGYLDLKGNNLNGNFPWSSLNLEHLSFLDLSNNKFTGQLPQAYTNLSQNTSPPSSLILLSLSNNLFDGKIPSWIFKQPSLTMLDLDNNLFTGELYEFHSTSLTYLTVGDNKLHGEVPRSIFQNVNLTLLDLSSNNFTGTLDLEELSKLTESSMLFISPNNLSLTFDNSINYTFENLQYLTLSSCNITEFPNFLKSSHGLEQLDLSYNQIHGGVPKWFGELGKDSLLYMNLSHNFLTSIDSIYWRNLATLDLRSNLISGPLPISSLPLLTLFASDNEFSGTIPTSICNLKSLVLLDLSYNNLSGDIPQCMGNFSQDLLVLDLRRNKLRGNIPSNFSRRNSLRTLNLNGNFFEGKLPRSLAHCNSLEVLDLGQNLLNDTFPNWLNSLPNLQVLVLRDNSFHGPIGFPKISSPFPELRIIDLSKNDFNGSLPVKYFEHFKAMMNTENVKMAYMGDRSYYQDSVMVTVKGNFVLIERILTMLSTIDLSNNNFIGEIPDVLGRLKSLKGLILSHNMLSGSMPSSLGNLSNLEWLDLSYNKLVGEIPNQLVDINWLSFLNLSYNHLEGPIPRGKQFNTFSTDSYSGNFGLCGFPLSKSCSNSDDEPRQDHQGGDEETQNGIVLDWKIVMMGYASGVVIGISIGYMVLFTTRFDYWLMERVGVGIRCKTNSRLRVRRRN